MPNILTRSLAGNPRTLGKVTTTNGTATPVKFIGVNAIAMPNAKAWTIKARVTARRTDSGSEVGGYEIAATIKRGANAAATALVGSATVTTVGEDTAAWNATITADTTIGGPAVSVTGEAAKTIAWTAQIQIVEA